jgi:hypothetical protein
MRRTVRRLGLAVVLVSAPALLGFAPAQALPVGAKPLGMVSPGRRRPRSTWSRTPATSRPRTATPSDVE